MMYTMPKNLLSICVNFTLATQQPKILSINKLAPFSHELDTFLGIFICNNGGGLM